MPGDDIVRVAVHVGAWTQGLHTAVSALLSRTETAYLLRASLQLHWMAALDGSPLWQLCGRILGRKGLGRVLKQGKIFIRTGL